MKKAVCLVFALLISVMFAISVSAEVISYEFGGVKFSLGSDYIVSTQEEVEKSQVNGLIFFAVYKNGLHQIKGLKTETAFSKEMSSFSSLSPEALTPIGNELFPQGFETAEVGNEVYLKQISTQNDEQTVVYTTVSGGKLFTFTYIGTDVTRSGEFIGTVILPDSQNGSDVNVLMIVVLAICIAGFCTLIIVLLSSFIRDYRHRKMEQSENIVSNYIKIKRRKY